MFRGRSVGTLAVAETGDAGKVSEIGEFVSRMRGGTPAGAGIMRKIKSILKEAR